MSQIIRNDCLPNIFYFLFSDPELDATSQRLDLPKRKVQLRSLLLVCKEFANTIYNMKYFWSDIIIDLSNPKEHGRTKSQMARFFAPYKGHWLQESHPALQTIRNLPVTLRIVHSQPWRCGWGPQCQCPWCDHFAKVFPIRLGLLNRRIDILQIEFTARVMDHIFTARQFQRLRNISTLVLQAQDEYENYCIENFLKKVVTLPLLKNLRVSSINMNHFVDPAVRFPSLIHLNIRTDTAYEVHFLSMLLSNNPQLRTLSWSNTADPAYTWGQDDPSPTSLCEVAVHCLEMLDIIVYGLEMLHPISHQFELPNLHTLDVMAAYDSDDQLKEDIRALFPSTHAEIKLRTYSPHRPRTRYW